MVEPQKAVEYKSVKYTRDGDWWTVQRITALDIAKVPSEFAAQTLISDLKKADSK